MRYNVGELGSGQSTNFYITAVNIGMTHLTLTSDEDWILKVTQNDYSRYKMTHP